MDCHSELLALEFSRFYTIWHANALQHLSTRSVNPRKWQLATSTLQCDGDMQLPDTATRCQSRSLNILILTFSVRKIKLMQEQKNEMNAHHWGISVTIYIFSLCLSLMRYTDGAIHRGVFYRGYSITSTNEAFIPSLTLVFLFRFLFLVTLSLPEYHICIMCHQTKSKSNSNIQMWKWVVMKQGINNILWSTRKEKGTLWQKENFMDYTIPWCVKDLALPMISPSHVFVSVCISCLKPYVRLNLVGK